MDNIFRSFFGFPRQNHPRYGEDDDPTEDGEDPNFRSDTFFFGFPHFGSHGPGPNNFNGDEEGENDEMGNFHFGIHMNDADQMFRHFEEMFRNMGMVDFPPVQPNRPSIEGPHRGSEGPSLRDKMLKEPDSQHPSNMRPDQDDQQRKIFSPPSFFGNIGKIPQWGSKPSNRKLDTDLDEEVSNDGLDSIFQQPKPHVDPPRQRITSNFRSESVRIVRSADGKVEEHRTVRDGQGNQSTTVTRRVGDKAHTVITKQDKDGSEERTDNFVNIDQNELTDFEKKWQSNSQSHQPVNPHDALILPDGSRADDQTKTIFERLFGFGKS